MTSLHNIPLTWDINAKLPASIASKKDMKKELNDNVGLSLSSWL